VTGNATRNDDEKLLLTYQLNSTMKDDRLKEYVSLKVEPALKAIESVKRVDITGGTGKYVEVSYDPEVLRSCGVTAMDIEDAVKSFMGRMEVIGEVTVPGRWGLPERKALYLGVGELEKPLEQLPVKNIGGSMIYMGDLATYEYKDRLPGSYYRVNGLSTIYLNIYVDSDASLISLSHKLRERISELRKDLKQGVGMTLTYNAAEQSESELNTLVRRSLMSLFILLIFIWAIRRRWRYLFIISVTLTANILIALLIYWLAGIRLHAFALAGITVSLGIIIDSSIVMVDHYVRHRDTNVCFSILAALLTTIGALVIIFFLPEHIRKDLYDFSWIIIINLSVSLVVAWLFVPPLVDSLDKKRNMLSGAHLTLGSVVEAMTSGGREVVDGAAEVDNDHISRLYERYIRFAQRYRWILIVFLVLTFGVPIYALPDKLGEKSLYGMVPDEEVKLEWYEQFYNKTLGSDYFVKKFKNPLSKYLGGTLRFFAEHINQKSDVRPQVGEKRLIIQGKMPVGGSMHELNDKMLQVERFLSGFPEIERFETRIGYWGGMIEVRFKEDQRNTSFPFLLENKVIGKLIDLGGADWSTHGISERGFNNSLNLAYRSHRIEIAGYNYDRLYRFAEDMAKELGKNARVQDLIIETPGHEQQEDELYMVYDRERIALDRFSIPSAHSAMHELLVEKELGHYKDRFIDSDIRLRSSRRDRFDLWMLRNSYIKVNGEPCKVSDYMEISRRQAKNCIPRKNQEYILRVAFNVLGSWNYSNNLIKEVTEDFNSRFPIGYRCLNTTYGWYEDTGTQYWLLFLVAVIIYFVCTVLFESLTVPLVIISLIPVSFIGTFLTFNFTGVPFGNGGFASMVLLAGIVVNAGIYQIYEYRSLLKKFKGDKGEVDKVTVYVQAFRLKAMPVFLTVLSTLLGFIPFLFERDKDNDFWFSLAVGSMGGLVFSIIAYVFIMPILKKFRV
ncbi:MAG: efflux RND transporter permease subunit, partial [Muribaculaceae bacterium]|nr:efflux RND transporter permease subunit [Muribaculaceae bacterium]